jgi:hypothetical protein
MIAESAGQESLAAQDVNRLPKSTKAKLVHGSSLLHTPDSTTVLRAMSDEDLKEELEKLRAENERLKQKGSRASSLKVSEKGGVSVYGLGRFPVTLYKEQWAKLLDMADDIRAFIKENEPRLKTKGDE